MSAFHRHFQTEIAVGLTSLFILLGIVAASSPVPRSEAKPEDVNVLLISIDTIRPDRLSCYSSKYLQTPHIDALAAKGVLFERAFAHNPMTLPSHVNIMTGTTPLYHGVHENSKSILAPDFLILPCFSSMIPENQADGWDQNQEARPLQEFYRYEHWK